MLKITSNNICREEGGTQLTFTQACSVSRTVVNITIIKTKWNEHARTDTFPELLYFVIFNFKIISIIMFKSIALNAQPFLSESTGSSLLQSIFCQSLTN
jgi:hypothetical protein